jgi:hypothetical protein
MSMWIFTETEMERPLLGGFEHRQEVRIGTLSGCVQWDPNLAFHLRYKPEGDRIPGLRTTTQFTNASAMVATRIKD